MRALANTRIALGALRAHKLRTALTSLGMVIGVAAVITMLAVGAGARERVVEQIRSMGTNLVLVWARSATVGGARIGARTLPAVSEEDAWALERELPFVDAAAPFSTSRVGLIRGKQNWITVLNAVTPEFPGVQEWDVVAGRPITQDESDTAAKVIVLGWTVAAQLFGDADPLGQSIRVKNVPFRVVGVLDRKGQSAWGQDQDDIALIPLSAARPNDLGRHPTTARAVESITVKISDSDVVPLAMQEIRALLRQRHGIEDEREDDFEMRDLTEMTHAQEASSQVLSMLLAAIASVSLLSGGVGIMNIMLVSVTERTREIGVRIAVGARSMTILVQFLIEALLLSAAGGLIGVAFGAIGALAVVKISQWPLLIPPEAMIIAFAGAAITGVFFGYYPARKAAAMNPIEALRFE